MLTIHPLVFAAAGLPYAFTVVAVFLSLPPRWAVAFAAIISLCHGFGVFAWTVVLLGEEATGIWALLAPASAVVLGMLWWAGGQHLGLFDRPFPFSRTIPPSSPDR
jgi:hypothetical protein